MTRSVLLLNASEEVLSIIDWKKAIREIEISRKLGKEKNDSNMDKGQRLTFDFIFKLSNFF